MYILNTNADIKIVLKAVLVSVTILIFPIFLNFDFLVKSDLERLWFGLHAYGIVKLAGGYAERISEGYAVHFAKNRALIIKSEDVFGAGKKVKPLKDYHFIRLYSLVEIGDEIDAEKPLISGFVINYIGSMLNRHFGIFKPYLKMRNDVNVYIGEKIFNLYFSGTVVFNLFMVVLSSIKICTEKIFYAFGKDK